MAALVCVMPIASAVDDDDRSMVDRFYQILVQIDPPSIRDEAEVFENGGRFSAVLKARGEESDTPRWKFLRENKNWFLPPSPMGIESVQISSPFRMFSNKLGRYKNGEHVLVYFSETGDGSNSKRATPSIRCILFRLSPDGRIDLDGTFFPEKGLLYDFVYEGTSPLPHE